MSASDQREGPKQNEQPGEHRTSAGSGRSLGALGQILANHRQQERLLWLRYQPISSLRWCGCGPATRSPMWGLLTLAPVATIQVGPGIDGRTALQLGVDIDDRLFDGGRNGISEGDKGGLDA